MHPVDNGPKTVLSPSEPDQNRASEVIDRRTAANRQNALKSTGPRTKAGKLAVAKNSTDHGIYTVCPVIKPVESAREWKCYYAAMLASLATLGMLEATLAERIILTAWRLRRVMRYETEQIRLKQAGAIGIVCTQLRQAASRPGVDAFADLEASLLQKHDSSADPDCGYDDYVSNDMELSEEDAQELLSRVHDALGWPDRFDNYWQTLPKSESWTAGRVRQLVGVLTERHCEQSEKQMAGEGKQRLDEYRREHLLPGEGTLEKVMRYEAHLSRLLHRDLHELQRLQAMRQGQPVVPPIAIDVELTNGSKSAPENGG